MTEIILLLIMIALPATFFTISKLFKHNKFEKNNIALISFFINMCVSVFILSVVSIQNTVYDIEFFKLSIVNAFNISFKIDIVTSVVTLLVNFLTLSCAAFKLIFKPKDNAFIEIRKVILYYTFIIIIISSNTIISFLLAISLLKLFNYIIFERNSENNIYGLEELFIIMTIVLMYTLGIEFNFTEFKHISKEFIAENNRTFSLIFIFIMLYAFKLTGLLNLYKKNNLPNKLTYHHVLYSFITPITLIMNFSWIFGQLIKGNPIEIFSMYLVGTLMIISVVGLFVTNDINQILNNLKKYYGAIFLFSILYGNYSGGLFVFVLNMIFFSFFSLYIKSLSLSHNKDDITYLGIQRHKNIKAHVIYGVFVISVSCVPFSAVYFVYDEFLLYIYNRNVLLYATVLSSILMVTLLYVKVYFNVFYNNRTWNSKDILNNRKKISFYIIFLSVICFYFLIGLPSFFAENAIHKFNILVERSLFTFMYLDEPETSFIIRLIPAFLSMIVLSLSAYYYLKIKSNTHIQNIIFYVKFFIKRSTRNLNIYMNRSSIFLIEGALFVFKICFAPVIYIVSNLLSFIKVAPRAVGAVKEDDIKLSILIALLITTGAIFIICKKVLLVGI